MEGPSKRAALELDHGPPPTTLASGQRIRLTAESVRRLGKSLAIVTATTAEGEGVDCILKRSAEDGEPLIEGTRDAGRNLSTWAEKRLVTYSSRAVCWATVVRVEEKKSDRGNWQIHLDDWTVEELQRVVHSDDEIWDDADLLDAETNPHGSQQDKALRHVKFLDWILGTFSESSLKLGDGVLDVGGGKGDVCRALSARGIRCTLVDPREKHPADEPFERRVQMFDHETFEARPYSLVIGMHADQGTEHVVRYALKHNLSFAVVPCCVFPREFPNREFRGGGVNGYRTFFKYLRSLCTAAAGGASVARLDFKGRNTILYRTAAPDILL